jgi:hypothetical protein
MTFDQKIDSSFSIPLDISDIMLICREYHKLGYQLQFQIESLLEIGVEQSLNKGLVKNNSLPIIKDFLKRIVGNVYFGDASEQAKECIYLLDMYEQKDTSLLN